MRKQTKVLLLAFTLITSLAAAPVLLAHDSGDGGMMERDAMMGNGGMMRMGSMMRMMDHCGQMMQDGARRPNDQWRKAPSTPDEKR